MSDDPLLMTSAQLLSRYRDRSLSPVEVTRAAFARITRLQPTYNAFAYLGEEQALRDASASEARWMRGQPAGAVDGLPTSVKDLLLAKGWPTRRGSLTVDPNQRWDEDSASVARMREQGAIILGKTTTPEFGWKGVTDSPLTGTTVNPWDVRLTPGGSSGGAAVACALGMGVMHIATDGGGSIRIPAGFCGMFGFKPTFGLVPVHPHPPPLTLWHQGPIARTVADAARMLSVISKPDARDFYAAPSLDLDYIGALQGGVRDWRIGFSPTLGYAQVDPEVLDAVTQAVSVFEAMGAHVEEVNLALEDPIRVMQPLWSVALAMAVQPMTATQRAQVEAPLLALAEPGARLSALEYRALEKQREEIARTLRSVHQRFDLLITPQLATTAFAVNHEVPPNGGKSRWWEWSPFTYPFNLSQQPAAALPCGFTATGLPVALQVVGDKFADLKVLRACAAFEASRPFKLPPAALGG